MVQIGDSFGPETVQVTVHLFPLPYHRNSHVLSKGAHVIRNFLSKNSSATSTVFDWFQKVYDHIDKLTPSATADKTDIQVLTFLGNLAWDAFGISPVDFKRGVADENIDGDTRLEWKYGCT